MTTCQHTDIATVRSRLDEGNLQLIDVRSVEDWQAARIPGAVFGGDAQAMAQLDPKVETVVYCYRGISSVPATCQLEQAGFTCVASMDGGFNSWKEMFGNDPEAVEYPK